MSDKYFDSTPRKASNVNKNGVSVASDGSGFYDCSLAAPSNSVTDSYLVPGSIQDVVSETDMTGSVPVVNPETESPYSDSYETR